MAATVSRTDTQPRQVRQLTHEHHRRLAEIGLRAAGQYGFALACGYAVQAHGILVRPSEDVDLFTSWEQRIHFGEAVEAVVDVLSSEGYTVEISQRSDTFARLMATPVAYPDQHYKVELAANWRAHPPVLLDIGPVLHRDDVAAGKMSALYTRAEPRDFLDVDAFIASGAYTGEELFRVATEADTGFDREVFAHVLGMIAKYPDRRFTAYDVSPEHVSMMRARFEAWRATLIS